MTRAAVINELNGVPEIYMDRILEFVKSVKEDVCRSEVKSTETTETTEGTPKRVKKDWRTAKGDPVLEAMAGNNGKPLNIGDNDRELILEYLMEKYK